ncbi:MAG: hypothetical protein ACSLFR_00520 [Solirubrobacteraceae bacterium]
MDLARLPAEERADFPRTGVRARRWFRFERDLRAWLETPEGRFAAWDADREISASCAPPPAA